jgi:hypothetical protein
MQTGPIWDRQETQSLEGAEERVNVWPIFYKRDPLLTVFWPIFAKSDDGHAVVPLYEYGNAERDLKLLSVHQLLPAAARFIGEDEYWRALNVLYSGGDEKRFAIVPIYYHDLTHKELLMIPVLWKREGEFWTPLLTRTDNLTGILGPLFFRYKLGNFKSYAYPWPILGHWSDKNRFGWRVFPVLYYNRDGSEKTFNFAALLFHGNWRADGYRVSYLAPFGAVSDRGGTKVNHFIPFWYRKATERASTTLSLPYTHIEREGLEFTNALLNGYVAVKRGDNEYATVLAPIFHRFKNEAGAGHAVAPLYYTSTDADGDRTFLSPLFGFKTDGSLLNIGGPVFHSSNREGDKHLAVVWPIYNQWSKPGASGRMMLPLFYASRDDGGGRTVITPIGGMARRGDRSIVDVLGPIYFSSSKGEDFYRTLLWPIWHSGRSQEVRWRALFPIFGHFASDDETERHFVTLPVSFGRTDRSRYFNLGGVLFHHGAKFDGEGTYERSNLLLLFLLQHQRNTRADTGKFSIFPVFDYSKRRDSIRFDSLPFNLRVSRSDAEGARERMVEQVRGQLEIAPPAAPIRPATQSSATLREFGAILNLLFHSRTRLAGTLRLSETGAPDATPIAPHETLVGDRDGKPAILSFERSHESAALQVPLLPDIIPFFSDLSLYHLETVEGATERGQFDLLWRLYNSKRIAEPGEPKRTTRRVLWHLYRSDSEGERTSVDVFPFIAYDRGPELKKFSFLGGFVGYERREDARTFKLLYIPFGQ